MSLFKNIYLLPLAIIMLLASCSNNDPLDNIKTEDGTDNAVIFNLRTTRGMSASPVSNDELISSYMIVVTQQSSVVRVLKSEALTAAEMHPVKAQLTAGEYKVYAFANIPFTTSGDYLFNRFSEGAAMPDLSSFYYNIENGMTGAIPMSNSIEGFDITVVSSPVQNFDIEVVRMVAKLEFMFTNSTESDAEVSAIKVSPLTTSGTSGSCVPLMWYNDNEKLTLSSDATTQEYTHTLVPAINVAANTTAISAANSTYFYIAESNPDALTQSFMLTFSVKHEGETQELRYALLDKSLGGEGSNLDGDKDKDVMIRRNDWLRIPIDLSSWQMRLEARTYPPIGGYPEAEIEETESNEFVVKFDGGGDFSIRPFVHKYSDGEEWFGIDNTEKVVISQVEGSESPKITVDDPDGIFTTTPKLTTTGEIRGRMAVASGKTACITIKVDVKTSESVTKTLTRKIFVTQK